MNITHLAACLSLSMALLFPDRLDAQWTSMNGPMLGSALASVRAVHVDGDIVFAGTQSGGAYRSTDGGATWVALKAGLPTVSVFSFMKAGKILYAGVENGTAGGGGVYRSSDSGSTWTVAGGAALNNPINAMAAADTSLFAGSWNARLYRLASDGRSWTDLQGMLPNDQIVALHANGNTIYAATYRSGIWQSVDHGGTWTLSAPVIAGKSLQAIAFLDTNMYAGVLGGVYRLNKERTEWKAVSKGMTSSAVTSFAVAGAKLFAGTMGGVFVSSDGGENWGVTGLKGVAIYGLTVTNTAIYAATYNNGVWRRQLAENMVDVDAHDSTLSYYPLAIGNRWMYRIEGGPYTHPLPSKIMDVTVLRDTVFSNGSTYFKILKRIDRDSTYYYERIDPVTLNVYRLDLKYPGKETLIDSLRAIPGDKPNSNRLSTSLVFCDSVVSKTIFGVATKLKYFSGRVTPTVPYYALASGFGYVYSQYSEEFPDLPLMYTRSTQLAYAKINGVEYGTVLAVEHPTELMPEKCALAQNYPNPFNPTTTIPFSLREKTYVSLKIFDVLGRDVASIASEELPAGTYSRSWNAASFSSGIYFYRLQAGSFTQTKRLILLR